MSERKVKTGVGIGNKKTTANKRMAETVNTQSHGYVTAGKRFWKLDSVSCST
jgi:hypothetical protein